MSEPAPAEPVEPPWTPPPTISDWISVWSVRAIRFTLAAIGLLGIVLGVTVAIPTWQAARSPGFLALKAKIEASTFVGIGAPMKASSFPRSYRLEEGRFEVAVTGAFGERLLVRARVQDGKVGRLHHDLNADWRHAWERRRWMKRSARLRRPD